MSATPTTMICPNPDCPWRKKHGNPAEYRAGIGRCSDCGVALVAGAIAAPAAESLPPLTASLVRRIAATIVIAIALAAAATIPAPGMDAAWFRQNVPIASLGLLGLGIAPLLGGFILVELASLLTPSWRELRNGGAPERLLLMRWGFGVSFALAALQAWMLAKGTFQVGGFDPDRVSIATLSLSLLGGFCVVVLGTWWIGKAGIVDGFALAAAAGSFVFFQMLLQPVLRLRAGEMAPAGVARFAIGISLVAGGTLWILRNGRRHGGIPLPSSGAVPLTMGLGAVALPLAIARAIGYRSPGLVRILLQVRSDTLYGEAFALAIAAVLVVLLTLAFNPPRMLERIGGISAGDVASVSKRAMAISFVYLAAIQLLPAFLAQIVSLAAPVAVLAAVALDAAEEIAARRKLGELVSVWPLHRVYAVEPARELLRKNGIASYGRSFRFRTLTQFFGPYAPIHLLVPPANAGEAARLLREHFAALPPPPGP